MPPNNQTWSERLLVDGRSHRHCRRRSRGRVRAWRSTRDRRGRVILSSRRFAATPPRRRSRHIYASHYYVTRTLYVVMPRFIFHFLCTMYSYYCTCTTFVAFTSRGRADLCIPVALLNAFVARPRLHLSNFITTYSLSVRIAFTSRCDCQLVRRSAVSLNRMSLFRVETSHYCLPRRASRT